MDNNLLLPESEIANPFITTDYLKTSEVIVPVVDTAVVASSSDVTVTSNANTNIDTSVDVPINTNDNNDNEDGTVFTLKDEIELWQFSSPDELYTMFKDTPDRYLPIFEKDRELAQKYGCLVHRDNGKLRVKYRIYPDDRWTECGFFEDFSDDVIHQEFADSVQRSLNTTRNKKKDVSKMSRSEYLKSVKDADNNRPHIAASLDQGKDEALDKDKLLAVKSKQMGEYNDFPISKNITDDEVAKVAKVKERYERYEREIAKTQDKINKIDKNITDNREQRDEKKKDIETRKKQDEHLFQTARKELEKERERGSEREKAEREFKKEKELKEKEIDEMVKQRFNNFKRERHLEEQKMLEEKKKTKKSISDLDLADLADSDSDSDSDMTKSDNLSVNTLLKAYIEQLLERIRENICQWTNSNLSNANNQQNKGLDQLLQNLKNVENRVPTHLLKDFKNLSANLKTASTSDFYNYMVNQKLYLLPRYLDPVYDSFLAKIISSSSFLGPEFNHNKLCTLLNLSNTEIQLLTSHKVDLQQLWNEQFTQLN